MTAPVIVNSSSAIAASSVTSITVPMPTGVQDGDLIVAIARSQFGGSATDLTNNAGFARKGVAFAPAASEGRVQGFYTRGVPLASALPANVTFTLGAAGRMIVVLLLVRGAVIDGSIAGYSEPYAGRIVNVSGGDKGAVAPAFTVAGQDSLVLVAGGAEFSAGASNVPLTLPDWVTPFSLTATSQATTGSRTAIWVGSAARTAPGLTPDAPVYWGAYSGGATQAIALSALNPGAGNAAPTASVSVSADALRITADGRASTDPEGGALSYRFECNGQTVVGQSIAVFDVPASGTYDVKLTVTDGGGLSATATKSVTVTGNAPPVAAIQWQRDALKITVDGSRSSDSDGTIASYRWDWGDGTAVGSGVSATHTYAAAGTYPLTLTVTDNGGKTATSTTAVDVVATAAPNVAPTAWFTNTVNQLTVSVNGTASADSDGTIASYAWDFGDNGKATGANASHTYLEAGSYVVTLTVTDNAGATGSTSSTVVVTAPGGTPWVGGSLTFLPPSHHSFTIQQMLAEQPFYWGHRGASKDWGEMTMRAYTNAVFWGAKCLEVSVRRSSDGVFVMSHDASTLRVTGVDKAIATTPYSELAGLPVVVPKAGGVIGRLDEVLAAYADLVLIIDDKTYQHDTAMLDLIETFYPSREEAKKHVIIKQEGGGGPWALTETLKRGYTTWGYVYGDKINETVNLSKYTLIGLDYQATAEQWAKALTYGKPVVGHIIDTAASATLALSRGASGLQVAAVKAVIPMKNNIA